MSDFEDAVRKQQAKQDAMRKELWPRFVEFRNGFTEKLTPFARNAFDSGVSGIKMPMIGQYGYDCEQMHITLNGHDLRLEYPIKPTVNDAGLEHPTQVAEKADTGKPVGGLPTFVIKIHLDTEEGGRVYGAVEAGYYHEGACSYDILQLMGNRTIRHLGGGPRLSREAGRQAATKLIGHFCSLKGK